jgi:L-asparaginase II
MSSANANGHPDNPVLVRIWRGDAVESWHRGAWVVTDSAGRVVDGAGCFDHPVFVRSAAKSLQALPLLEGGAAERFSLSDAELALCLASHNAERCHTDGVLGLLQRLDLGVEHLQCGPQWPGDSHARRALEQAGERPTALHNNCSGKHTGFLALARHVGVPVARYLEPDGAGQAEVRRAVLEMTGVQDAALTVAVDGCSAPTFRMPLVGLATAFARVANPAALPAERRAACERMTSAVGAHPVLIAGNQDRLCTDLARASGGRLFPKVGAEAVYAVGVCGADRGLAVKIDDGGKRNLHSVVLALLAKLGELFPDEARALRSWTDDSVKNRSGLVVGRAEVLV